jgi:hypothetical protein
VDDALAVGTRGVVSGFPVNLETGHGSVCFFIGKIDGGAAAASFNPDSPIGLAALMARGLDDDPDFRRSLIQEKI